MTQTKTSFDRPVRRGRPVFVSDRGFYETLKQRVTRHFHDMEANRTGGLFLKAMILLGWFVASYLVLLSAETAVLRFVAAVSLGAAAAGVGFNIFHDANHGSFLSNSTLNDATAIAVCMLLGPSRFLWHQKHQIFHHRFTNLHEWDDDIETRGVLRMSPDQPCKPWHRFQVFYWPVVYAVSTLEWFYVKDFKQYVTGHLNPYLDIPKMNSAQHLEFWFTKIFYIALFAALPVFALGLWPAIGYLFVFHLIFGLILTSAFQLAHMNDLAVFPRVDTENLSVDDEWAVHQMRTTADFAPNNRLVGWYFGGLNAQVVHHLFPGVSHRHYPALSRIIAQTAREFGVPYNSYQTYRAAMIGHLRNMVLLSVCTDELAPPSPIQNGGPNK